jgi:hypothetical protein
VTSVKRRVAAGELPVFRDGRLVRVREADLRRYIAERTARRASSPAAAAAGHALPEGARLWD